MKKTQLYPATLSLIIITSLFSAGSEASLITWQSPQNETGQITDILTAGTLFTAVTSGQATSVGGVTFNTYSGISPSGLDFDSKFKVLGNDFYGNLGSAPTTWDAGYQTLVSTGAVFSTGTQSLELSELNIGDSYTIQIFEGFWDSNWATSFSDGTNVSALVNFTGPDQGAGAATVPQYLVGTFTADSTTQSIYVNSPTGWHGFGAAQIRTQASNIPEPSILTLLGLGLVGLGLGKRE